MLGPPESLQGAVRPRTTTQRMGHLVESSPAGARGVICLPYLVGERFPMMNPSIRGAYVGISSETKACDLARAALEGVSYSIRQGLDLLGTPIERVTLIGGGAREPQWCQMLADNLTRPFRRLMMPMSCLRWPWLNWSLSAR